MSDGGLRAAARLLAKSTMLFLFLLGDGGWVCATSHFVCLADGAWACASSRFCLFVCLLHD